MAAGSPSHNFRGPHRTWILGQVAAEHYGKTRADVLNEALEEIARRAFTEMTPEQRQLADARVAEETARAEQKDEKRRAGYARRVANNRNEETAA